MKERQDHQILPSSSNSSNSNSNSRKNPLETASYFSKIFLTWLNPIVKLGTIKPLENQDVPPVPYVHSSKYTLNLFLKYWKQEVQINPKNPRLWKVLLNAFGWNFYLSLFTFTLFLIVTFLQPTFVSRILNYVNTGKAELGYIHSGIAFAVILGVLSVFQTIVFNLGFFNMQCFGLQLRPALIAALFHKSLRISNSARASHPTGEIITLMSVDVERIWLATLLGNWLWMSPLMLIVAVILLFLEVGYPSLIVAFVLISWGYFQEIVSGWVNNTRTKLVKCTGQRTMLTNEALQGIRVLKLYAWEDPSQDRINNVREDEMKLIRRYTMLRMMNTILQFLGPVVVAYILFLSYALIGGTFTVQKVYTAMSILNITRLPISLFPMSRTAAAEAFNSIARIKKYLLLPELIGVREITTGMENNNNEKNDNNNNDDGILVKIVGGYFDWNENKLENNNININNDNQLQQHSQNQNDGKNNYSLTSNHEIEHEHEHESEHVQQYIEIRNRQDSNASIQSQVIEVENIDQYLDIPQEDIEMIKYNKENKDNKGGIGESFIITLAKEISNPKFTENRPCTLSKVNLEITNNDLIAIVGSVGAGKTSLLTAILGQMTRIRGSQTLKCRVAYAGQEHWIQNLTLKDNVLFDEPFNEDRYADCLDASQLSTDLINLPNADYTEIGERGINLSGGQKARVNLARALYASNVNLYLLDDILASVDVHVGKAIFESAILDLLKDSARVLVLSSNYHLLPYFNKIIIVNQDGIVNICTSYDELRKNYKEYSTPDGDRKYEELLKLSYENNVILEVDDEDNDNNNNENLNNKDNNDNDNESNNNISKSINRRDILNKNSSTNGGRNHSMWYLGENNNNNNNNNNNPKFYQSNRSSIFKSMKGQIEKKKEDNKGLTTVEDRERGEVSLTAYISYFSIGLQADKNNNTNNNTNNNNNNNNNNSKNNTTNNKTTNESYQGLFTLLLILLLFAIGQAFRVWTDLWIGIWAKQESNGTNNERFYILIYTGLIIGTIIFVTIRGFYFMSKCLSTSQILHNSLIGKVFSAPINTYFDVTPLGRILNRFSKDLDVVDCQLPDFFLNMLQNMYHVFSVLALCIASTPYFAILFAPLAVVFYFIQELYRKTSRELKRLDAVSRSPLYTLFGETLVGLSTVRAYGREEVFMEKHHRTSDDNAKHFFIFWNCSRWLAMRLDLISNVVVLAVGLIAVIMVNLGAAVSDNILGLALVYSLQLAGLLQWTVRTFIETENNMTSVERLLVFNSIQSEAQNQEINDPSESWPKNGAITLKNLSLCYRPGLPRVLNSVNLTIPGGIKVGVCGRTGAGKSSLMLALFRIVEPEEGSIIEIDGINILDISLKKLRTQLTIIPQDPVMFSGTLRYNLDPFGQYQDQDIWEALERVHLKEDIIAKFPLQLSHEVSERGENISVGQRQLLCIARALLRKSKVIVMDEATASVDSITDKKIQSTIRSQFLDCTILTIAHRLETIADYDRIVVMSAGQVAEYGPLHELLAMESGQFRSLVDELGPEVKEQFLQTARNKYDLKELNM